MVRIETTISAHLGNGIFAKLTRDDGQTDWSLQVEWANGEEALDYPISLNKMEMASLIEALSTAIITEKESNN